MRYIKKRNHTVTWTAMFFIISLIVIGGIATWGILSLDKEQELIEENIGSRLVIEGDTLLITSYQWWEHSYFLSNGTKVSTALLDDLELIKP